MSHTIHMKTKDNARFHIVLVTGVIENNGKVLIAQRSHDEVQAPGKWALPGGKVELFTKENDINVLEKTLAKEIKEEVDLEIKSPQYIKSSSFVRVDNASVISILFLCSYKAGRAKPLEDSIDIAWIKPDQINQYDCATGVAHAISIVVEKMHE